MQTPAVVAFDAMRDKFNWPLIAIRPRSKVPAFKKWTSSYWADSHRKYLLDNPHANIGLLLGVVIDIEADTPEANELAKSLIGNIPHLSYRSERSVHHLFSNPFSTLGKIVWRGIEFRAKGHQSVLPPSVSRKGNTYEWIDQDIPLGPLPKNIARLIKELKSYQPSLTTPRCHVCKEETKIALTRFKLELAAFSKLGKPWICRCCRKNDIRNLCRKIKKSQP